MLLVLRFRSALGFSETSAVVIDFISRHSSLRWAAGRRGIFCTRFGRSRSSRHRAASIRCGTVRIPASSAAVGFVLPDEPRASVTLSSFFLRHGWRRGHIFSVQRVFLLVRGSHAPVPRSVADCLCSTRNRHADHSLCQPSATLGFSAWTPCGRFLASTSAAEPVLEANP